MAFTENLAVFFADFGVPCSVGAVNFTGILDRPDETLSLAGVNVLSTMYQLAAQTSDVQAAGVVSGTAITMGGQAYVVRDVLLLDDGAVTSLTLSK